MSASANPFHGGVHPEKRVPCPACRQPAVYAPSNPFRPFCCAQCRAVDLAAWASEGYRVDAVDAENTPETGETADSMRDTSHHSAATFHKP